MKLLSRTTYILITTILLIFAMGGTAFYYILKNIMEKEIREELTSRLELVQQEIRIHPEDYDNLHFPGYLSVSLQESGQLITAGFADTILPDPLTNTFTAYEVLSATISVQGKVYLVHCFQSLEDSYSLTERIILIVTITVLVLFMAIYILNRFIFERTWADFFKTLQKLSQYDINKGDRIRFDDSDIYEFQALNTTLNQLIEKIHADYENIRQFTGNISHEIQTPLTVIRQKSEMLLQDESMSEKQLKILQEIQGSITRLSRLNKTLVLLSRIESRQFTSRERISLNGLLSAQLEIIGPLAEANEIRVGYEAEADCTIEADPTLADILLVNLLKNAVTHNFHGGDINISLGSDYISISNSGREEPLDDKLIFERYHSNTASKESLGLGLAIVKKICDLYEFHISYNFVNSKHIFRVEF